jgi:peroxiredoxin
VKELLKYALVVALVAGAGFTFVRLQEGKGYALKKGTAAPTFRLPTLSGGDVDLASFRGRLVVVNFWATWCPPCVEEMPSLERLHRKLAPEGLVLLSVSADEDEPTLRRFVAAHGLTFPVLRDPGGAGPAQAYHTTGYPETFVIDGKGVLVDSYIGPAEWDTPEAVAHFRELLKTLSTSPTK